MIRELIDKKSSLSSTRASMMAIVVVVLGLLIYLTISVGIGVAEYLIWALAIGVSGKAIDAFASRGKSLVEAVEPESDKSA